MCFLLKSMAVSLLLVALAACGSSGLPAPLRPLAYRPPVPFAPDYEDDYAYAARAAAARYPHYPPYEPEPADLPYYYAALDATDPLRLEERAAREAALPVGQETWYESEPPAPRWRQAGLDDVNAAFLQNLIISQMARNAESRARELAGPAHAQDDDVADSYSERDVRDFEDEDVRELKALAGKPLYHSAKTEPRDLPPPPPPPTNRYVDYYDYPADDSFINWDSKRSVASSPAPAPAAAAAASAAPSAAAPTAAGQREEVMLRPATPVRHPFPEPVMKLLAERWRQEKRATSVYDKLKHILTTDNSKHDIVADEAHSRLKKRFVASEPDLAAELHGLKRRIVT